VAVPRSDETRAIAAYLKASGVPHRITASTNHTALTLAGFASLHVLPGTNGPGRALDVAAPTSGRDTPELLAVFNAFRPVEHLLYELIYAGAAYNIKRGKPVLPYATASHHDHVHVAVARGVILPTPQPNMPPPVLEDAVPVVVQRSQGGAIVVTSDGGVFAVGPAPYLGSLPQAGVQHPAPIVGGAWAPLGDGYWLVARDGATFAFGNATPIPGGNVEPLRSHIGARPVVGVYCVNERLLELVALDTSRDGSPFDTYLASA